MLSAFLYRRFVPVRKIPCQSIDPKDGDCFILDIRTYNNRKNEIERDSMLNIPYAKLERYNKEIPSVNLHVVASDRMELNLGIRLMASKG